MCASGAETRGCGDLAHHARAREIADVQNVEAVVPVADVKPVSEPQGMVAFRFDEIAPKILLAAGLPLAGNPPAGNFPRPRGIEKIENDDDVADISLRGRGYICVPAVEIVAVNARAAGLPLRDEARRRGSRHIVDREPSRETAQVHRAVDLVIDDHDIAMRTHLVRMPALRQVDARQQLRIGGIGDVIEARAAWRAHVPDIQRVALDPDLSAAGTVDMTDAPDVFT